MGRRYKWRLYVVVMSMLLTLLCASCANSEQEASLNTDITSAVNAESENESGADESQELDIPASGAVHDLIYLQRGDTKSLVGFSFGDEFDYELFEISGYGYGGNMYRLKDSESQLNYIFAQPGNRFSGLSLTGGTGDFFGLTLGEDTLPKLVSILGEPQIQQPDDRDGFFAIYYFEQAYLSVKVNVYGTLQYARYMSLTEFEKDFLTEFDYAEAVYNWNAIYNSRARATEASYHPYDEGYEESKTGAFIENYLRMQGIDKDMPDGVTYNQQGEPLAEFYIDADKSQYCFVIHLWGDYWIDYEAGTSRYTDAVYCTTYYKDERDKLGNLIYEEDSDLGIIHELAYDAEGKRMADITYEYSANTPFPFIMESRNLDAGYEMVNYGLLRNQKIWFDKEQAVFDDNGKFISYKDAYLAGNDKDYFSYPSECIYDADGRLITVEEKLSEEDIDRPGYIELEYNEHGGIKSADYFHSPKLYGTTDSSGIIVYDDKGRMICNEYYITHGRHINIFVYKDDSERPWACFYWCNSGPGIDAYIFEPMAESSSLLWR